MEFLNKYRHLSWVLLLIPIYAFMFLKLGAFHIRLWDEGWFVVHVYEMMERGSLLVPYYDGQPVFYGSKPPLQTWLQMIAIKLIGYNELAVRLPSAIAAGATVLIVFHWVRKNIDHITAWAASLTLLTIDGFIEHHTARGAEADALLTLVIFGQVYFFWEWISSKNRRQLYGLAIMIALSFWVKNVAGFMMLPGMLLFLVFYDRDNLSRSLKDKSVWLILFGGIIAGVSYLLFRELTQPGHLNFILEKQAGRLVNDVGHDEPFAYYFHRLKDERMATYLPLALMSLIFPFFSKLTHSRPAKYSVVLALTYFLVISIARSKLEWYLMPIYPLLAIAIGFLMTSLLGNMTFWKRAVLLAVFFALPLHTMFLKSQANKIGRWSKYYEMEEQYLFDAYESGRDISGLNVIHDHFDGALLFYKYKFREAGQHINLQNNTDLEVGEKALVNSDKIKSEIIERYIVDTLDQLENAMVFEIKGVRDTIQSDTVIQRRAGE